MLTVDHYCSVFAIEGKMPGDLRAFFQGMGFLGHGTGCFVVVALIWSLDRKNKIAIPLVVGSVLLAGAITTVIKILAHRPRPFVDPAAISDGITFSQAVFQNSLQSFPSGHTATAFALAIALSLLYQRGKTVFLLFATFVGVQRIISQNHFPSDVIAGALVGVICAKTMMVFVEHRFETRRSKPSPVERAESGCQQPFNGPSPV